LDPHRFQIIKDSWTKTDKSNARNLVKALWVHLVTAEFGIPLVYKPSGFTRELRTLFSQYELLNRQIRMLKNTIQAILLEKGIVLEKKDRLHREILHTGEPLEQEVKRLITIKGITPLTALAFLAEWGT
jgi:transposase